MMKKYKTGGYSELIEKVEITRETSKSVWIIESWQTHNIPSQARKRSESTNFFDTWDEAYMYIYQQASKVKIVKEKALAEAKNHLEKIRDMKLNKESE